MILYSMPWHLEGTRSTDSDLWQSEVEQFGAEWETELLDKQQLFCDLVASTDGAPIGLSADMLLDACRCVSRRAKPDHYRVSSEIIYYVCRARPEVEDGFLSKFLGSSILLADVVIEGRLYGKESSTSSPAQFRAILPPPAFMQVMDVLLPRLLAQFLDDACSPIPGCFVGARPGTQTLDIAHGLQSIIEKGLDDKATQKLHRPTSRKFLGSLDVLLVAQWLQQRGARLPLCSGIVRHQMLPQVQLQIGRAKVQMRGRSVGCLTSSRVAGFLGRVLVEKFNSRTTQGTARIGLSDAHACPHSLLLCL